MLYYLGLDGDFVTTFARNLRKGIYPCNSYRDLPHNSSMCDSEATQKIHELNVMHIHVLKIKICRFKLQYPVITM